MGTFADDTSIMASADTKREAMIKQQQVMNTNCKIKLNEIKPTHCIATETPIPQTDSAKYLDLYLFNKLNWKHHIKLKAETPKNVLIMWKALSIEPV